MLLLLLHDHVCSSLKKSVCGVRTIRFCLFFLVAVAYRVDGHQMHNDQPDDVRHHAYTCIPGIRYFGDGVSMVLYIYNMSIMTNFCY